MTDAKHFDELMMRRAIELARRGLGYVEPNPVVGAIVVDPTGTVVGEGWHQKYGGPHAEVHALAQAGTMALGATLYVTLEPCCHFGKTPPCSRAVIAAGIHRVVIGMRDPNPRVDGGGIVELRNAGISVEMGLLEQEAKSLVAPFLRLVTQHRPWFHGKWAMTLDGKIATRSGDSKWITNEASRAVVHQLRGRMDGILVGIGTAIADNPALTARPKGPRIATRIVVDSTARLPVESQLVQTVSAAPVLVLTTDTAPFDRCTRLRDAGVEVVTIETGSNGKPDPNGVSFELGRRRFTNVLIEGGGQMLGSFFDKNLIDEVHAFIANKLIGGSDSPSPLEGIGLGSIGACPSIEQPVVEMLDGDIYLHGQLKRHE
jgi:diaminohydroxyphosphoribosylaminopyrimidine deaminase / 5-amino-6-(5-phosphoribosylamino)uracil reductase